MKQSILSLEGVEVLSKNVKKSLIGGRSLNAGSLCTSTCNSDSDCFGYQGKPGGTCNTYDCDGKTTYKQCNTPFTI